MSDPRDWIPRERMVFRDFVVVRDHDNGISSKGSKMNKAVFMNRPWLGQVRLSLYRDGG